MVWKELLGASVAVGGCVYLGINFWDSYDNGSSADIKSSTRPPQATPTPPPTPPRAESPFEAQPSPVSATTEIIIETVSQEVAGNEAPSPSEHVEPEVTLEPTEQRSSSWRSSMRVAWRVFRSIARKLNIISHIRAYKEAWIMNEILEERNRVSWIQRREQFRTIHALRDELELVRGPNLQRAVNESLDRTAREAISWAQ